MYLSAKEFSEKHNFPLKTIRRMCREGVVPRLLIGKKYAIDEERALDALASQGQGGKVLEAPARPKPKTRKRNFNDELNGLKTGGIA